jgi:hypothetical protein
MKAKKFGIACLMLVSVAVSTLTSTLVQAEVISERPSPPVMVADAVLMRPVMLGATLVGSAIYVLSLPFSLMGGNAEEVGQSLVVKPFKATFIRCLGCTSLQDPSADYY